MSNVEVRLRVLSRRAPPVHEGKATEFGIQDKKRALHPGEASGNNSSFSITANARDDGGKAKFSGPFIHRGSGGTQHLYLGWRHEGQSNWINRLKVQLDIPWPLAREAAADGGVLETDGTAPEWGVLKNWHALGVGKDWTLKKR